MPAFSASTNPSFAQSRTRAGAAGAYLLGMQSEREWARAPDVRGVPIENDFSGQALELRQKCLLAGAAFAAVPAIRTLSARAVGGRLHMGALRWVLQP